MRDTRAAASGLDEQVPVPHVVRDLLLVAGGIAAVLVGPQLAGDLSDITALGWLGVATLIVELLLPLAVVYGRGFWTREVRGLFIAMLVWAWLVPLLRLFPSDWLAIWTPADPQAINVGARTVQLAFLVAHNAGPALVAVALMDRRETVTALPRALAAVVLVLAAGLAALAARESVDYVASLPSSYDYLGAAVSPISTALAVAKAALSPIWLLSLAALLWFAWSGVRAGEKPALFWRLLSLGSGALLLTWLISFVYSVAVSALLSASPALGADEGAALTLTSFTVGLDVLLQLLVLAAYVMLLVGFAFFLPELRDEVRAADPSGG